MAQDVRLQTTGDTTSFDFNSQAGVLLILQAIRASDLSVAERNELRDLVFLYANGGGDPALRNLLEERLLSHTITLALVPPSKRGISQEEKVTLGAGFAGGRLAPIFTPIRISHPLTAISHAEKSESPQIPIAPIIEATQPVAVKINSPVTSQSSPAAAVIRPVTPVVPVQTPLQTVAKGTPNVAIIPTAATSQSRARLDRIREIKADINARVGNPVTLIAINNSIGHEYMTVLLEAMKQLNAGSESMIVQAMQRLEVVYEEVKTILESGGPIVPPPPKVSPIIPTIPVQPVAVLQPVSDSIPPVSAARAIPVPVPVVKKVTPVVPEKPKVSEQANPAIQPIVATDAPSVAIKFVAPIPPIPPVIPVETPTPNRPESTPVVHPDTLVSNVSKTAEMPAPFHEIVSAWGQDVPSIPITSTRHGIGSPSVAEATPLRTPADLPDAASIKTASVTGDPLYTKEVDDGLDQLLSEWVLFKKSGLFGTGPKGREHPLFKKIAGLQIPLLLSGRFEGAAPEIKQSITDYMNGWRYEQGIVYEKGEVFEQYLRRVIRHIIDWQNKKHGS